MHAKARNKKTAYLVCQRSGFICLQLPPFVGSSFVSSFPLFSSFLSHFMCFISFPLWQLRRTKTTVLKLLRTAGLSLLLGTTKTWPRWFSSLFFFFPSADALCGDDEGDVDEGVLCWLSSRPCLCVFLLSTVSLSALSLVVFPPFLLFFLSFFFSVFFSRCSLFCFPFPFFHSNERIKKKINSLCSLRFLSTPSVLFFSFFCSLFSFSYCLPLLLFFLLLFRSVEEAYI